MIQQQKTLTLRDINKDSVGRAYGARLYGSSSRLPAIAGRKANAFRPFAIARE
jgi:hypothetical protein